MSQFLAFLIYSASVTVTIDANTGMSKENLGFSFEISACFLWVSFYKYKSESMKKLKNIQSLIKDK